jgi:hypothetical protein
MKRMVNGIRIRMGTARFRMITFPMARKLSAVNFSMDLLRENQVPQKTPVTSNNKARDINSMILRVKDMTNGFDQIIMQMLIQIYPEESKTGSTHR